MASIVKGINIIITKCPTNHKSNEYDLQYIQSEIYETLSEYLNVAQNDEHSKQTNEQDLDDDLKLIEELT